MIGSDGIRGYIDPMILFLLQDGPSYGYEIGKRIREVTEARYEIKETTLYSSLTRLERNGYIASFYGNESGGKRRTYYRITDDGTAYYREKRLEWQAMVAVVSRFMNDGQS